MPILKHKNWLKLAIFVLFFSFILIPFNVFGAETCAQKYPDGDGECLDTCPETKSPDKSTDLCDATKVCCHQFAASPHLRLQVPIFTYTEATNIAEYITKLYEFSLVVLIPIAIVIMIYAGIRWILAGGDAPKIKEAKKYISGAFSGVVLALLSYVVLSFFGLSSLQMGGVQYIAPDELPARGNTFISGGRASRASGPIAKYDNTACPNISGGETDLEVYFTNYYVPAHGDRGSYIDFWCNIAVQCSCPAGRDSSRNCGLFNISADGYRPCAEFPSTSRPGVDYCNKSSMGRAPTGNHTIAADMSPVPGGWGSKYGHKGCFKQGCTFTIVGDPSPGREYVMEDRGSAIIGLHLDYFVGIGEAALRSNPIKGSQQIKLNAATCAP
jgi:hypothetical protein